MFNKLLAKKWLIRTGLIPKVYDNYGWANKGCLREWKCERECEWVGRQRSMTLKIDCVNIDRKVF